MRSLPLRVLWHWLLYTLGGIVVIFLLVLGAGDAPAGKLRCSWRTLGLCFAGALAGLIGAAIWLAHAQGGSLGDYWPAGAIAAWVATVPIVIASWYSIAAELGGSRTRTRAQSPDAP